MKTSSWRLYQGPGRISISRYAPHVVPLQPGLRAEEAPPRPEDLIVVWDHAKRGYRSIPVEGLAELRIDGGRLEVCNGAAAELSASARQPDGKRLPRRGRPLRHRRRAPENARRRPPR